jgi:hypothetical protein
MIGRVVAVLTPFLAAAAAWLAGFATTEWGIELNKEEIIALMVAVVTAGLTSGWKWLDGLQKHEQRVSEGLAKPIKAPKG